MKLSKLPRQVPIIIAISVVLVLVFFIIPFIASALIYDAYFNQRYDLDYDETELASSLEDFPELGRTRYEFSSGEGETLVGYNYYYGDGDSGAGDGASANNPSADDNTNANPGADDVTTDSANAKSGAGNSDAPDPSRPRGLIVLAHGLGAGHRIYLDAINFFASHGYWVFAYDGTGVDESGGDSVRGLPQSVADLDAALNFLESEKTFADLPLLLFGHSQGGYSVASVLAYHPGVAGVVSIAGFSRSLDLVQYDAESAYGSITNLLMPYVSLHESLKFGNYASATGLAGLTQASAPVLVIQGAVDDVVPSRYGYDIYYDYATGADSDVIVGSGADADAVAGDPDSDSGADSNSAANNSATSSGAAASPLATPDYPVETFGRFNFLLLPDSGHFDMLYADDFLQALADEEEYWSEEEVSDASESESSDENNNENSDPAEDSAPTDPATLDKLNHPLFELILNFFNQCTA